MTEKSVQAKLWKDIPLAKAIGASVVSLSAELAVFKAPLAPNLNHNSTAFGGSIHSLGVLACLTLVTKRLERVKIDYVVIQSSQVEYLKPIKKEFSAEAEFGDARAAEKLISTLEKKKLARVLVRAQIKSDGEICAVLSARFVAGIEL